MEFNDVEDVRVTRNAKSAQPTVTKIALNKTLNESDINKVPASHAQFRKLRPQ